MVKLGKSEKRVLCIEFAEYLPGIRDMLRLTQSEFGSLCGISTDRLSRIENEHAIMTWSQYTSILFLCMMNMETKEYLLANNIVKPDVLQYFQRKAENIPPDITVEVHEEIAKDYMQGYKESRATL